MVAQANKKTSKNTTNEKIMRSNDSSTLQSMSFVDETRKNRGNKKMHYLGVVRMFAAQVYP